MRKAKTGQRGRVCRTARAKRTAGWRRLVPIVVLLAAGQAGASTPSCIISGSTVRTWTARGFGDRQSVDTRSFGCGFWTFDDTTVFDSRSFTRDFMPLDRFRSDEPRGLFLIIR